MWQNLRVYGQCSYIRCLQSQIIFSFRVEYTSSQTQAEKIVNSILISLTGKP